MSTIAGRFRQATLVVAAVSSIVLAAASAFIALSLWETREAQLLRDTSQVLGEAIAGEASGEGTALPEAASEAFRESGIVTHRTEVWRGGEMLVSNQAGPPVGPLAPGDEPVVTAGWIALARPIGADLVLVVAAPRDPGTRVFRVFGWSLLFALPVAIGTALLAGRSLSSRVARPVAAFRDRISGALPMQPLATAPHEDLDEVRDLESTFAALWNRLNEGVAREREFAANASHELRTPLTRLRLLAERAREGAGAESAAALSLQVVELERLTRLIDALLLLARDTALRLDASETVNLADLVRSSTARLLKERRADVQAPDEALVRGEEELLAIAVDNLLENAAKFGAEGQPIRIAVSEASSRVRLEVATPGARIPAEDRERLFERFYRGPEARIAAAGHGLGLPLARHVARLHGGDVVLESAASDDPRFVLDLPGWSPGADKA